MGLVAEMVIFGTHYARNAPGLHHTAIMSVGILGDLDTSGAHCAT